MKRNNHSQPWLSSSASVLIFLGVYLLAVSAQAVCTNALSSTFQSFLSTAASSSVNVIAATGCAWTATSNDSFITITSGASGTGNGTVNYSITANTSSNARGGTMTIAGQTFTVVQAAAPCTIVLSATGAGFGSAGGSSNVIATASATNCVFFANSNDSWLSITAGSSLVYTGKVSYTVAANSTANQRSGTLNIGGQIYTVTQAGVSALQFGVAPTNGVTPLLVTFTDTSAGTITNRTWTFGDGTSLSTNAAVVTHTYGVVPPGDVNKDGKVTGADSLLINQTLVGLRTTSSVSFQTNFNVRLVSRGLAGVTTNDCVGCVGLNVYPNGDVTGDGAVTGADPLRINQVLVGLRTYVVTKIVPSVRSSAVPTAVTIYGIGFSNTVTGVTIGPPVNLTLSSVVVISREQINALVPAGGGLGTGTVDVAASPSTGFISVGKFINQ